MEYTDLLKTIENTVLLTNRFQFKSAPFSFFLLRIASRRQRRGNKMSSFVISLFDGHRNRAPHTSVVLGKKKGRERTPLWLAIRGLSRWSIGEICARLLMTFPAFTIFLMSPRFNYKKNRTASLASWHMCNDWLRMMDKRHPSASLGPHSYT